MNHNNAAAARGQKYTQIRYKQKIHKHTLQKINAVLPSSEL